MSQDAFDLASKADIQIVDAYRRSGLPALHDSSGVSLVLRRVIAAGSPPHSSAAWRR